MNRAFLAGEGKTELGGRAGHPSFQDPRKAGVLEALLRKVRPTGVEIVGAIEWKDIRKFVAYKPGEKQNRRPELQDVVRAAHRAFEEEAALVFSRDRDRDRQREKDIEDGIEEALRCGWKVAGAVAVEEIEAWILACEGRAGSEVVRDPKGDLAERGITSTAEKVAVIDRVEIDALPTDASSLRRWCGRVRALGDDSQRRDRGPHGLVPT